MTALLLIALSLPAFAGEALFDAPPPPELLALEQAVLPELMARDPEMYDRMRALRERDLRDYTRHLQRLHERLVQEQERAARAEAGQLREVELEMMRAEEAMRGIQMEFKVHEAEMQSVEAQLRAQAVAMRATESEREQKQIYKDIEALAEEMFDVRVALQTAQIELMREKLTRMEAELEDQMARRDVLIQEWLGEKFEPDQGWTP